MTFEPIEHEPDDYSEGSETSAGEADSFQRDLDRHMQDPEFRRSYEEQARRLEAMSDGRLAQIAALSPFPFDHPATQIVVGVFQELLAEVKRQRGEIAKCNQELQRCVDLNRQLVNEAADAQEALAELRGRIGEATVGWGVRGGGGTFAVDDEAAARWHTLGPAEPMTVVCRVLGEWKVVDDES